MTSLALLGLIMVCIFGVLLVNPLSWFDDESDSPAVIETNTDEGVETAEETNAIVIFDGSNSLSINLDVPTAINLNEDTVPVKAQFVSEVGEWQPSIEDGRVAEWVYGTIVNPVFGLSASEENELALQKLVPGDTITVNYASGETQSFVVSGREFSETSNAELFAQNRPGVTLVWLGEPASGSRLVVFGDYTLPETATNEIASSRLAAPGEPVSFSNLTLTVNNHQIDAGNTSAPAGFSVYLVDFVIANQGANVFDSGLLRISLKDSQGNQYLMNPNLAVNGTNPILTGFVDPGTQKQATAAFQIPAALAGDQLEWTVARSDIPGEVTVGLPFGGNGTQNATVSLSSADVSEDGGSITVSGTIGNGGTQPFVVNPTDVSLTENGTVYLVFSTTPGFPWSVPPGQVINFTLSFQRPVGPNATFTLLGNSFNLEGIR